MVHIVVVNYHTHDDLQAFLDSLDAFRPKVHCQVTVVDVEQGEEAMIATSTKGGKHITWLNVEKNIGYARACNLGALQGIGENWAKQYTMFFNADVRLLPRAIDQLHDAMEANPSWGVIGPKQVSSQNKITHAGIFGTNVAPKHRGWQELNRGQYQDTKEAITVSGSAYMVRNRMWDGLTMCPTYRDFVKENVHDPGNSGAFLPTPHYYEETWCSYHARAHGWDVVYFGEACVIHEWHKASPVGGAADSLMPESQKLFRAACDAHGIARD